MKQPDRLKFIQVMGPGLITGASDDDPSGIATYSQVGAQFGYGLAWTLVFSYPLMAAIQEISARIGRVTGFGIAGNLRRHYPRWLSGSVVTLLLAANMINLGADLGAMGAALKLLIHGPALVYVVLFAVLSAGLQIYTRYARYVAFLKYLCLALFSYVICAFLVKVPWEDVGWAIVWPPLSSDSAYLMAITAVLGTTISPYLFFWQAEQEVEDEKERTGARPLIRAPEQARGEFARIRIDTYIGMAISNLIALFIVITTAATLHAHGMTDIQTSAQAAEALRRPGRALYLRPVRCRHHRHRHADRARAGRIGGLRAGRGAVVACRPGPPAAACPRLLWDHRRWRGAGRGAELLAYRPDPGALLERGAERRGGGAGDGGDDASDHAPGDHGRLHAAAAAALGGLGRDRRHGGDRGRAWSGRGANDPGCRAPQAL